jgi:hypothetical protein
MDIVSNVQRYKKVRNFLKNRLNLFLRRCLALLCPFKPIKDPEGGESIEFSFQSGIPLLKF